MTVPGPPTGVIVINQGATGTFTCSASASLPFQNHTRVFADIAAGLWGNTTATIQIPGSAVYNSYKLISAMPCGYSSYTGDPYFNFGSPGTPITTSATLSGTFQYDLCKVLNATVRTSQGQVVTVDEMFIAVAPSYYTYTITNQAGTTGAQYGENVWLSYLGLVQGLEATITIEMGFSPTGYDPALIQWSITGFSFDTGIIKIPSYSGTNAAGGTLALGAGSVTVNGAVGYVNTYPQIVASPPTSVNYSGKIYHYFSPCTSSISMNLQANTEVDPPYYVNAVKFPTPQSSNASSATYNWSDASDFRAQFGDEVFNGELITSANIRDGFSPTFIQDKVGSFNPCGWFLEIVGITPAESIDQPIVHVQDTVRWQPTKFNHLPTYNYPNMDATYFRVDSSSNPLTVGLPNLTVDVNGNNTYGNQKFFVSNFTGFVDSNKDVYDFRNYRFLTIGITTNLDNLQIQFVFGNPQFTEFPYWNINLLKSKTTYEIDLCNPNGKVTATNNFGVNVINYFSIDNPSWTRSAFDNFPQTIYGVQQPNGYAIIFPANKKYSFTVSTFQTNVHTTSSTVGRVIPAEFAFDGSNRQADTFPDVKPHEMLAPFSATLNAIVTPLLIDNVDGKRAAELPRGNDPGSYSEFSIQNLIDIVNTNPAFFPYNNFGLSLSSYNASLFRPDIYGSYLFTRYLTLDTDISGASTIFNSDMRNAPIYCQPYYLSVSYVPGINSLYSAGSSQTIILRIGGAIEGTSVDGKGDDPGGVSGGSIELHNAHESSPGVGVTDGLVSSTTTNSDGYFSFPYVQEGIYAVKSSTATSYCFGYQGLTRWEGLSSTPVKKSKYICKVRDFNRRMYIFYVNGDGNLIVNIYGNSDENTLLQKVTIDNSSKCAWPSFHENGNVINGTFVDDTTTLYTYSGDHGVTWNLIKIPIPSKWTAGFIEVTSCIRINLLVVMGYHKNDPNNGNDPQSGWYQIVGTKQPDGSYQFGSNPNSPIVPVYSQITNAQSPAGHLSCRSDNVLEFVYIDQNGDPAIVRCTNMAQDSTGTWA